MSMSMFPKVQELPVIEVFPPPSLKATGKKKKKESELFSKHHGNGRSI